MPSLRVERIKEIWPTFQDFIKGMNAGLQMEAVKNTNSFLVHVVSPKLREIESIYGANAEEQWVTGQILEVARDMKTDKDTTDAIKRLAKKMMAVCHWNTAHELILFCGEWSCGRYGKVFGSLNVNDALDSLAVFQKELQKRKQAAIESYANEQKMVKKPSDDSNNGVVGDEGLREYLKNAPAESLVAYWTVSLGLDYEISQEALSSIETTTEKIKAFEERMQRVKIV